MNLPNILTLTRVLLIPVFVILVMNQSFGWALFIFAVAGITDGADGLIARLTRQRTELGAYLDPIADKLLLSSAFITLAIFELLPSWLTVIVITRDVIILVGILVMTLNHYEVKIQPSLVGKVTTTFQISTILLVLMTGYGSLFKHLSTMGIYGTTVFTILSGAHYIYIGTRILNQKKERGR
ncbi:MAG: CDP-diacylglycerol--glycerol-3-phosphate 3-phosphatidyltransferase [Deltaproteobacteria bacterium RBG_16_50_11]|nr:MAG: CDP-diacylglycerol--glycerol-3-phosphate 3-phosphatidyltransferase [Deltaproteobacteria bacterium RBG_16_50_11]